MARSWQVEVVERFEVVRPLGRGDRAAIASHFDRFAPARSVATIVGLLASFVRVGSAFLWSLLVAA